MYRIETRTISELDLEEINHVVKEVKAHPFQTVEWMQVCKHESVIEPRVIVLRKNGKIIAYWMTYFRDSEFRVFKKLSMKLRWCIARAGPVIVSPESLDYIGSMVDVMRLNAKELGAKVIDILSEITWKDELGKYVMPKGFSPDSFCTYLVDLSLPLESIWKKVDRKSARWGIKKAQRNNVKCIEANSEYGFECFARLVVETWKRSGKNVETTGLYEKYKPLIEKDMCKLFLAEYDNSIVSGLLLVYNNELGIYYAGASSELGFKVCANDFLQWNAIVFCKSRGMRFYDLLGTECNPRSGTKQYNLKQFKGKWGGELIYTPRYRWYSPELRLGKKLKDVLGVLRAK